MTLGACFYFFLIATCASDSTNHDVHAKSSQNGLGNVHYEHAQTLTGNNGLSSAFISRSQNTCHKQVFKDPQCYTVTSHQSVIVMQCGTGTYFNNQSCSCDLRVDSLPYDLAPVNCHRLHSQHLTSHQNTLACNSASYTFLESLKTQNHCYTSDAIWSHLEDIKIHTSIDCVKKIVAELDRYYTPWNHNNGQTACTCNGVKKYISWPTEDTSQCYYHDTNFNHMYRTVFGSRDTHNTNTYGRSCASQNTMWAYVDAVSNAHTSNTCLEMLLRIMTHAFQHVGTSGSCSCSVNAHVTTTHMPALHANNDYCRRYSSYTDIHNLIGHDQCLVDHTAFVRLSQLISAGTTTAKCADRLISDMYAVYGRMTDTPTNCSCSGTDHSSSFSTLARCTHIPIYKEIAAAYGGTSQASCHSHHKIWSSLNSLMNTDVSCLYDVVRKIATSSSRNVCSCHAEHATTITAAPVTQSHSSQCHEYSGHQGLMKIISADKCVSYTKVWGPLHILGSQRHDCLVQAINHLAASYNHFDNRTCSCSHSGSDDLVFQNFHGGHYSDCMNHFHTTYKAIMTNVLGTNVASRGSQGYCWTHQSLWSQLRLLAATNTRSYCLTDLINHLALSTQRHTDTCSCHPVSVTSTPHTQHPVTVQPTSHPATTKPPITVQPCQKLETLIALAHNSYLVDNAVPCPSGGHSKAEATVVDLCKAPASIAWRKGYNVLHHCHDIPQYTAVASFAGNLYLGDGVSGILISCNTTSLRIATERCDHPMEVVTVVAGTRDQYTHMAENYYTIHW